MSTPESIGPDTPEEHAYTSKFELQLPQIRRAQRGTDAARQSSSGAPDRQDAPTSIPSDPSPMDLINIVKTFNLAPPKETLSSFRPDMELNGCFLTAAHIYHIARQVALLARDIDPTEEALRNMGDLAAFEELSAAWEEAAALGPQVDEETAIKRIEGISTPERLHKALLEFGTHYEVGQQISMGVIWVFKLLRDEVRREKEAVRKRRARARGSDDAPVEEDPGEFRSRGHNPRAIPAEPALSEHGRRCKRLTEMVLRAVDEVRRSRG